MAALWTGVGVGAGVAVGVAVGSGTGVAVAVGSRVGAGVAVGVVVGSGTGVSVAVGSGVCVGVSVGAGTGVGVTVGVGVSVARGSGLEVGVGPGGLVDVCAGTSVGSAWPTAEAVSVGAATGVGPTVAVGAASVQAARVSRTMRIAGSTSFVIPRYLRSCRSPSAILLLGLAFLPVTQPFPLPNPDLLSAHLSLGSSIRAAISGRTATIGGDVAFSQSAVLRSVRRCHPIHLSVQGGLCSRSLSSRCSA